MKSFVILVLLWVSQPEFAMAGVPCDGHLEAQFIAKYNQVEIGWNETQTQFYRFGLKDFTYFQMSGICPLTVEQALSAKIFVSGENSNVHNGGEVSGVLVFDPAKNTFWIE
jgi:hypothetical protein